MVYSTTCSIAENHPESFARIGSLWIPRVFKLSPPECIFQSFLYALSPKIFFHAFVLAPVIHSTTFSMVENHSESFARIGSLWIPRVHEKSPNWCCSPIGNFQLKIYFSLYLAPVIHSTTYSMVENHPESFARIGSLWIPRIFKLLPQECIFQSFL